jgi:hypothetical protein
MAGSTKSVRYPVATSERALSRIGAASGVLSFIVTFAGFGLHGGLPSDTSAPAIVTYTRSVSSGRAGAGNYLELLGYVLLLVFATYLYGVARANGADRLHWLNVLAVAAATAYVTVSAVAIAAQQTIVESSRAAIDAKTALSLYILDDDAFSLSFEIAATFAIATGLVLATGRPALRTLGGAAILAGAVLLITGLIGTISIQTSIGQAGLLVFELWLVAASVFFLVRPEPLGRHGEHA